MQLKQHGFNLVELMVSMAIMCLLMVAATPTYSSWMSNMRIRNTAESIHIGLTQARSEAIRRNDLVQFNLLTDTSWDIRTSDGTVLNQKASTESSINVTLVITPNLSTKVTFNGLGQLTNNIDSTASLSMINLSTNLVYDGKKELRVMIGGSGSSKICEPSVADTADVRYCNSM